MEKEKGFIRADIERGEESIGVDITIKNLDRSMAYAGLKGILNALAEQNKIAALFVWAKASCDAFGYKHAAAALNAYWRTEGKKKEEKNGDE